MRIGGQSMLADVIAALLIFTVLGGSLMWMWSNNISELQNQIIENEMKQTAERTLDSLIRGGGQPSEWEEDIGNPDTIGLAKRDRVLDEEKLNQFIWRTGTLDRGLVAVWHFDEGTGNTTEDSSGNGNDGTLQPVGLEPTWQATDCQSGSCLSFDGVNDYVNAGTGSKLNLITTMSVFAWIKIESIHSVNNYIVSRRDAADSGKGYALYMNNTNDKLRAIVLDDSGYSGNFDGTTTLVPGKWYQVGFTSDGSTMTLYVDGHFDGSDTSQSAKSLSTDFLIGIYNDLDPGYAFNGQIDEVRVYNRALDESEIRAMQQWTPTFERLRLLIGGNDYYFRLVDPKTGNTLTNSYGDLIETGTDPSGIVGSNLMQTAVRRTVTYNGGAAIVEIILYRIL